MAMQAKKYAEKFQTFLVSYLDLVGLLFYLIIKTLRFTN